MDLVVQPSCQTPRSLLSPPSSWVSPKSTSKAPELSLLQTPQVVKVSRPQVEFVINAVVLFGYFVAYTFYVFVVSASSSLGCFGPCVLSLHPSVYLTQQPEAHTSRHPFCLSRTLHHPTTPQQREPDHLHRKGRISWTREGHQVDQWGKTRLWLTNCILQGCGSLGIF